MITVKITLADPPVRGDVTIDLWADFFESDDLYFYASVTGDPVSWNERTNCELSVDFKFRDGEWLLDELGIFARPEGDLGRWNHRWDRHAIDDQLEPDDVALRDTLLREIKKASTPENMDKLREQALQEKIDNYKRRIETLENEISQLAKRLTRYLDMQYG